MPPKSVGLMELFALSATILFVLVSWVVSLRLLGRARRTGGVPEWFLGLGLLMIAGLGLPFLTAGRILALSSLSQAIAVAIIGMILMTLGWANVAAFTWRVFRPASWAGTLGAFAIIALLTACCIVACRQVAGFADPSEFGRSPSGLLALLSTASILYGWAGLEAFRSYLEGRKRVRIGLADPQVIHRFLFWALVMAGSLVSVAPPMITGFAGGDINAPWVQLSTAISGTACAYTLYRAFLAPFREEVEAPAPGSPL